MSKRPFREGDPSALSKIPDAHGDRSGSSILARLTQSVSVRGLGLLRSKHGTQPAVVPYTDAAPLPPSRTALSAVDTPLTTVPADNRRETGAEPITSDATGGEHEDHLRGAAKVINTIATVPQQVYALRPGRIANHSDAEVINAARAVVDSIMDTPGRISQKRGSGDTTVISSMVTKYGFEKGNPRRACFVALERSVNEANGSTHVKMTFWGTSVDPVKNLSAAETIAAASDPYSTLLFEAAFPLTIPFDPHNITIDNFQQDAAISPPSFSDQSGTTEMSYLRTIFANITPDTWDKEEVVLPASLDTHSTDVSYEDTDDPNLKRDSAGLFDLKELGQRVGPLTIRGHHLLSIYNFLLFKRDPAERAAEETAALERKRSLVSSTKDHIPSEEYIGHDKATALAYEEENRDIYRWLRHAPDDTPITLTGDTPDSMCATCYFAPHCSTGRASNGDSLTQDSDVLDEWLTRLGEQKPELLTNGAIQISSQQATFSDAPPREIKVVQTTIGVLKSINFRYL